MTQELGVLLPCPLCGKEVLLFREPSKDGTIVWGRIMHGPQIPCGIKFLDDFSQVVKKWNQRVKH